MLKAMRLSALLVLCAAVPALADTRFQIRRMTRNDVPLGKGQCDIRLQVDNEVEVSVRLDQVFIRTISGRDAIRLLAEPSRRNNYTAIVRIRDSDSGEGRYHFRLSWQMTGSDYRTGD